MKKKLEIIINNDTITVKSKENEKTAHEMPSTVIQHGGEKDVDCKWKSREGRRIVCLLSEAIKK